jgi:glutaminase
VSVPDLQAVLDEITVEMLARTDRGAVAGYIPQLARVDPGKFGIAVALVDGRVLTAGDADESFSIQSVSKVFTLTLALGKVGDAIWRRVGREPSGNPFNSIVQLEHEAGVPRNPFINAGAIVVADMLLADHQPREAKSCASFSSLPTMTGLSSIIRWQPPSVPRDFAISRWRTT